MQSLERYYKLLAAYKLLASPLFFVRSGNVNSLDGNYNNAGSNGNYWSSTANNSDNAYELNFNSSNVNPTNNNIKLNGQAVRCVAGS